MAFANLAFFICEMVSSQKIGGNKTIFHQTHHMTIEARSFAFKFNGHIVRLALRLWSLLQILETTR
jgi:hypothetical protein